MIVCRTELCRTLCCHDDINPILLNEYTSVSSVIHFTFYPTITINLLCLTTGKTPPLVPFNCRGLWPVHSVKGVQIISPSLSKSAMTPARCLRAPLGGYFGQQLVQHAPEMTSPAPSSQPFELHQQFEFWSAGTYIPSLILIPSAVLITHTNRYFFKGYRAEIH